MTAFADIVAAVAASLAQAPAVCDLILRAHDRRVPETKNEAINVMFVGSRPEEGAILGAPVDWESRIVVECYAKTMTESADAPVDRLLGAVYARLAQDVTLGGLVHEIKVPTVQADYDSQGQKTGWVLMTYPVTHRTANNTLESAP